MHFSLRDTQKSTKKFKPTRGYQSISVTTQPFIDIVYRHYGKMNADVNTINTTVSQKHNKKLYYTRICIMWKQLHVSAFFLGHHQVVHTSLRDAVYGFEAVTAMMRSHASYNISV